MLKSLKIVNVAIIEKLNINFDEGLNILSGETGAGKSIIVDSLNFVLGAKADKTLIRSGNEFMQVEAVFEVADKSCFDIEIEDDNLIVINRKLFENGKGEIKVNGDTYSVGMLKNLTCKLIDIYGQSEHTTLANAKEHKSILDNFAKEELSEHLSKFDACKKELKELNQKLSTFGINEFERQRMLDLQSFAINEIESANLQNGEEEELVIKKSLMQNAEKITKALSQSMQELAQNEGCAIDNTKSAKSFLHSAEKYDETMSELCSKLEDAINLCQEVADSIDSKLNELDFDENSADRVFERLEQIKSLKRKYGEDIPHILAYLEKAKTDFEWLSNSEEERKKLLDKKEVLLDNTFEICQKLHEIRQKYADILQQKMEDEFCGVALKGAKFSAEFQPTSTRIDLENNLKSDGFDDIQFLFSANVGEYPRPLSKIASGGEMSRLMLALKQIVSDSGQIECQVFDEIDSGMSGQTVFSIAKKLANIAVSRQILCISHSASIVAFGDTNFLIKKYTKDGKTISEAQRLDKDKKIVELARLLSGMDSSSFGSKHAEELLATAEEYKRQIRIKK